LFPKPPKPMKVQTNNFPYKVHKISPFTLKVSGKFKTFAGMEDMLDFP